MKQILVLAIAFFPAVCCPLRAQPPGAGVKSSGHQKDESRLSSRQAKDNTKGTAESPLVVEIRDRPKTSAEVAKEDAKVAKENALEDRKEDRDRWAFSLTCVNVILTGLLVIVGALGVIAALRTLRVIERQVGLMEAQFDQWVEPLGWITYPPANNRIRATVTLTNSTEFPLELTGGLIRIARQGAAAAMSARLEIGEPTFLTAGSPLVSDLFVDVSNEESMARSFSFPVSATIYHRHRTNRKIVKQVFDGYLNCGYGSNQQWFTSMFPTLTPLPDTKEDKK